MRPELMANRLYKGIGPGLLWAGGKSLNCVWMRVNPGEEEATRRLYGGRSMEILNPIIRNIAEIE